MSRADDLFMPQVSRWQRLRTSIALDQQVIRKILILVLNGEFWIDIDLAVFVMAGLPDWAVARIALRRTRKSAGALRPPRSASAHRGIFHVGANADVLVRDADRIAGGQPLTTSRPGSRSHRRAASPCSTPPARRSTATRPERRVASRPASDRTTPYAFSKVALRPVRRGSAAAHARAARAGARLPALQRLRPGRGAQAGPTRACRAASSGFLQGVAGRSSYSRATSAATTSPSRR